MIFIINLTKDCIVCIVSFVTWSPSGGKSPIKTALANPRSHAIFRKNVLETFKSCFDIAKRKIAKNVAHPTKKKVVQNKNISVVTKHWKYRIWVPMSYRQQAAITCGRGARGQLSEILGTRLMHQNPIVQALFGEKLEIKLPKNSNPNSKSNSKRIQSTL